ncbi:MAG: PTS sugar transporter subunit IIA [Planctomycetes bacterium]|nr:PTS sugar transporter subunit IIA [Planctomycetota bacterium]
MKLAELLPKNAIVIDLKSADKKGAIKELASTFKDAYGFKTAKITAITGKIMDREKQGTTGVGGGVAVPHAKIEGIDGICGAFGKSAAGIDFSAIDGEPVNLIFLVIAPPDKQQDYLETIKRISIVIRKPNVCKFLKQIKTVNEVIELLAEMDDLVK